MTRAAAEKRARALFARARPARPGQLRRALPAPGLGRPAAAGDDRDGALPEPRAHRLRRADDGARRDHPDRGAGRDQARDRGRPASPRSTSPTTSRWSPRSPTTSWCCATAGPSSTAPPGRSSRPRARTTPARLVNVRGTVTEEAAGPDRRAAPRRGRHRRLRRPDRCCTTCRCTCRRARRSPSSASRARASRRSPASSPACCRRPPGRVLFEGAALPPALRGRDRRTRCAASR